MNSIFIKICCILEIISETGWPFIALGSEKSLEDVKDETAKDLGAFNVSLDDLELETIVPLIIEKYRK